jgi:hypothetical protein
MLKHRGTQLATALIAAGIMGCVSAPGAADIRVKGHVQRACAWPQDRRWKRAEFR